MPATLDSTFNLICASEKKAFRGALKLALKQRCHPMATTAISNYLSTELLKASLRCSQPGSLKQVLVFGVEEHARSLNPQMATGESKPLCNHAHCCVSFNCVLRKAKNVTVESIEVLATSVVSLLSLGAPPSGLNSSRSVPWKKPCPFSLQEQKSHSRGFEIYYAPTFASRLLKTCHEAKKMPIYNTAVRLCRQADIPDVIPAPF